MADSQLSIGDPAEYITAMSGISCCGNQEKRAWFAAYTAPQSERSVVRHLDVYQVESFLPTFETTHAWKNRQKKKIVQFPSPGLNPPPFRWWSFSAVLKL